MSWGEYRRGHAAVALCDETMWVCGGRAENGRFLDDSFLLRLPRQLKVPGGSGANAARDSTEEHKTKLLAVPSWLPACASGGGRFPPARCDAAACACCDGTKVALFGGRDASSMCLSGVWLYCVATRTWSEPVVLGAPAAPRFGHAMLPFPSLDRSTALWLDSANDRGDDRLLVLGGCDVSSVQQHAARGRGALEEESDVIEADAAKGRALQDAAQQLAQAYADERTQVARAARAIQDLDLHRRSVHGGASGAQGASRELSRRHSSYS